MIYCDECKKRGPYQDYCEEIKKKINPKGSSNDRENKENRCPQ